MFSLVDALVLRPLPLPNPDRLVTLTELRDGEPTNGNPQRLEDWQAQAPGLAEVAGVYGEDLVVSGEACCGQVVPPARQQESVAQRAVSPGTAAGLGPGVRRRPPARQSSLRCHGRRPSDLRRRRGGPARSCGRCQPHTGAARRAGGSQLRHPRRSVVRESGAPQPGQDHGCYASLLELAALIGVKEVREMHSLTRIALALSLAVVSFATLPLRSQPPVTPPTGAAAALPGGAIQALELGIPKPTRLFGTERGPCTVSVPCRSGVEIRCTGQTLCLWRGDGGPGAIGFVNCDGVETDCPLN